VTLGRSLNRDAHTVTIPVEHYERMKRGLERYEFVRRLNVQQFKEMLFDRNLQDGIPFDELVDIEMASELRRNQERLKEALKQPGRYKQGWEKW
jgi:hypothetical protein